MLITQKLDVIEKNWLQIWLQHPKIVLNLSATKILLNSVSCRDILVVGWVRTIYWQNIVADHSRLRGKA